MIRLGLPHKAVDYEGTPLPGVYTPLRLVADGRYVECRGPQGGLIHIKPTQLTEVE